MAGLWPAKPSSDRLPGMTGRTHSYHLTIRWTGNRGTGTSSYSAYSRDHVIDASGKTPIEGSSDPAFRGDPARWNPEELLLAALSACHKLWYLHLAAEAGIRVSAYEDRAEASMVENPDGSGHFTAAVLRPRVTVRPQDDLALAARLHHEAHRFCFIAASVNFPVTCEPQFDTAPAS